MTLAGAQVDRKDLLRPKTLLERPSRPHPFGSAAVLDNGLANARSSRLMRIAPAAAAIALLAAAGPPPQAGRREAPPGIESRAARVQTRAPAISLPTSGGSRWTLERALSHGPAVLVFYRGDW
jgi:hypothetical protein